MPQHAGPADPTEPAERAEPTEQTQPAGGAGPARPGTSTGPVGVDAANGPAVTSPISYEQARDELVEVVRRLETGGTSLEEALALWERGEELAAVCERFLEGARNRLDAAVAAREETGTD